MTEGHIITTEEFFRQSRATSLHLDEEEVMAFVDEVEQMHVIPAIGYPLFEYLTQPDAKKPSDLDDDFDKEVFMTGGTYSTCGCGDSEVKYFKGIKAAVAYYAYAKMARSDGSIIARAGYMRHRDDYAEHVDDGKLKQYNDVMNVAETYMARCIEYLNVHRQKNCCKRDKLKPSRANIKAIGE